MKPRVLTQSVTASGTAGPRSAPKMLLGQP